MKARSRHRKSEDEDQLVVSEASILTEQLYVITYIECSFAKGTNQKNKGHTSYPTLEKWPNISKRHVQKVGQSVLNILVSNA